jgi:hypothetical protein
LSNNKHFLLFLFFKRLWNPLDEAAGLRKPTKEQQSADGKFKMHFHKRVVAVVSIVVYSKSASSLSLLVDLRAHNNRQRDNSSW